MSYELKFFSSYLDNATYILHLYDGEIPFVHFIKKYFSQNKKFGSKDRKQITNLCYAFFRLGKAYPNIAVKEKILLGLKYTYEPGWQQIINDTSLPKLPPQNIFPWKDELSETIDATAFEASFLTQPDLFLRIRPEFEKAVVEKLKSAKIGFEVEQNTIRLNNATKIDTILRLNKEAVIQDLSSQKISFFLSEVEKDFTKEKKISVYDCCAASGGKSILAQDFLKDIDLTVSDIRLSIIANLKKRFREAGITNYSSFVADLTRKNSSTTSTQYNLVIADVPCTGSGTWARTPEQLFYFEKNKIDEYATLQHKIIGNIISCVKPGGFLLYITCSVFKKENEKQIEKIMQSGFKLCKQKIIKGYDTKADTMFAALLQKL